MDKPENRPSSRKTDPAEQDEEHIIRSENRKNPDKEVYGKDRGTTDHVQRCGR